MKPIRIAWAVCVLVPTALWLLADPLLTTWPATFIGLRDAMVQYAGIVTIAVMSVALMLATRPVVLEPPLGGLDKMYRLHKWLGITALVTAIVHWLWTQMPHWLVDLGWLVRAPRVRPPPPDDPLLRWVQQQRELAEGIGEWAFYAAVVLIVLALVRRFPYRHFFSTHRTLAAVYLVLVFHALMLMKTAYWSHLLAPSMAVLMAGGSVAAVVLLFRRAGRSRQAFGTVERISFHPTMKVLEVDVRLESPWAGHEAGQFAFVRFDGDAEPHPFTLSSAWEGDGRLLLIIKELGDYTASLQGRLKVGDLVRVEGPYGRFNFHGLPPNQIWIGGGIGITPFVARMKHLARHPDGGLVELFHAASELDARASASLRDDARASGVKLHVMIDAHDGPLTAERIRRAVPDWISRDVWFCGPVGLGAALKRDLRAAGLPTAAFHDEIFNLR